MGADEVGTLAELKGHRKDFIEPKIAEHHGRIVKLMGDGTLVEFASVVDAVECAAEIQRGMTERNAYVPEDRRIAFRIGINLGDVIIDGEDIYGEGVNVAARLQGLAEPGGVCVSGTVYDQIEGKLALGYEFLGKQQVKNIAKPVRVYSVSLDQARGAAVAPKPSRFTSGPWPSMRRRSGRSTPGFATDLNNLAGLYHAQGKYAEAEPLYKRTLAIREMALGPEHPQTALSFNNLALLYFNQGRYAEAEPLYKRALAIKEKALRPEHPNVATTLENYAALLRQTGRSAEATEMEARAEAIRAKHAEKNTTN
jgi:tetratricopeptide (TPR) repeat protein